MYSICVQETENPYKRKRAMSLLFCISCSLNLVQLFWIKP